MCGIIGRVSKDLNPKKTLRGIKELEYRGYDSFGIYMYNHNSNEELLIKDVGEYTFCSKTQNFQSNVEIGHTRWATHGGVTKENAHPHFDSEKKIFVVMNGIIENFSEVRNFLKNQGYHFSSETDTEVIPALFAYCDNGNFIETIKNILSKLEGEFSFLLKYNGFLFGYKNINPLTIGKGKDEFFISSDSGLVQKNSDKHYNLRDSESFLINYYEKISIKFFNKDFEEIYINFLENSKDFEEVILNEDCFMRKEIYEQKNLHQLLSEENMNSIRSLAEKIKTNKKIILSAAGTSYHAAMYLHYLLLRKGVFSQCILASELKNYTHVISDSLIIVFSQSGETADLIYPLREIQDNNQIFSVINSKKSTIDNMSNFRVYLNCGKEVAVASTKAFLFQMFFSHILEKTLDNEKIDITEYELNFNAVIKENYPEILRISSDFCKVQNFFFIGRCEKYPLALEGALKLKEISYIHAEGFAGGELKHGSLALIEKDTPVLSLGNRKEIISNAIEVKSRGGNIIGIASEREDVFDYYLKIPDNFKDFFSTILMQLIALEVTLLRGNNPDKPRNLAKSVTVK